VEYLAGTATEIFTPTEPLWLAGYLARTVPATDKISDLRASALALEDSQGRKLIIASIDLIAVTKIVADPVYEIVEREIGVPRERLILAATHTHYGPEFRPDKAPFFRIPDEYAAKIPAVAGRVADVLARVIIESTKNLEPVRLFARRTTAGFAHNRRRGGIKDGNASVKDILDQDVPVLDVVRPDGSRKAIVFGYACHNTTIPPEDCRYCADWAGFAKEQLETSHPGATALFITGCGADQNPEPRGSVEISRRYGAEIGSAVEQSLQVAGDEITGSIQAGMEDIELALEPMTCERIDRMLTATDDPPAQLKGKYLRDQLDRGEALLTSYSAPLQAVKLGDNLLMILMSGETVVDWAIKFKREFADRAKLVWVAGYCNDMYGYVPTRRVQQEGGYEGGRANLWSWLPAPFKDDLEDRITVAARQLVARVST